MPRCLIIICVKIMANFCEFLKQYFQNINEERLCKIKFCFNKVDTLGLRNIQDGGAEGAEI